MSSETGVKTALNQRPQKVALYDQTKTAMKGITVSNGFFIVTLPLCHTA
jgi:hypothetical protein